MLLCHGGAVATASGTTCVYEQGVDYPGGQCSEAGCTGSDIRFIRNVPDAGACCRLCHKENECVYWTYATAEISVKGQRQVCWLKTAEARWLPDSTPNPKLPRLGGSPTHVHSPSPPSTMIFSRPFSLGPLVRHWPYLWQKTRLFLEYRASRRSGVRHGAAMMSGYVSGRVEDKGEGKGPTAERQAVSEASKASRQESKPSNVSQESAQR